MSLRSRAVSEPIARRLSAAGGPSWTRWPAGRSSTCSSSGAASSAPWVALDAATRGLSVALVERGDLAQGTSRWSSKLAHGGLRYLAQGEVGVAWESARERAMLMGVSAPHLIRPLPMLIPLGRTSTARDGAKLEAGVRIGDALRAPPARAGGACRPRGASVSRRRADSRRASATAGCAARCCTGTGRSRTTRGSWSRSREPPRPMARASSPTRASGARRRRRPCATRRAHRRTHRPARPPRRQRDRGVGGRAERRRGRAAAEQGLAPARPRTQRSASRAPRSTRRSRARARASRSPSRGPTAS